jgi:UDP-glucose 4-epimerase
MTGSSFANSTILVVGGAGFVGSALVRRLLEQRPRRVMIVDNLLSADISSIPEQSAVEFVFASISDDKVLEALPRDLDFVFHLACYHGNQSSIHDPLADHLNNTLTTLKLFDRLKGFSGLRKVVYSAAGCAAAAKTFDDATATQEDAPVSLYHDSPYAISKLVGEMYGNYYYMRYGLPFVKARFQNVYGPGEILGAGRWRGTPHTVWRNVTPTFVWKSLQHEALPVENGGVATRDFIFVEDIVDGLIACALRGRPGEVYNLASGIETSIRDLARLINKLTGNPTPIALAPARDWDRSGRRFGAPEKARQQLDFSAATPLRDGLERTIAWTRANRDTIRCCMLQHARFLPEVRAAAGKDSDLRILTIVGARPQFVKAAAMSRAFAAADGVSEILVHTGQHFDAGMSQIFFDELGLAPPRVNLGIHSGSHGEMTGRMLAALERLIIEERPDLVLVPGDTTSTLAGALAAAKLNVPIAHLEAGLRSFNRRMPEEVNRVLTDHVSALLLCPTKTAVANLDREGIFEGVHHIGDVMYDATLFAAAASRHSQVLDRLGIAGRPYAVATVHRAESTGGREKLAEILAFLRERARDCAVVFPLHPRTRKEIEGWKPDLAGIVTCDPVGYLDMHRLLQSAVAVFTDSGGLQKEAYFHRVPCVTLRSETEWVETIEAGWNRLWKGPDFAPRREIGAYGDGHAAEKAAALIVGYLTA